MNAVNLQVYHLDAHADFGGQVKPVTSAPNVFLISRKSSQMRTVPQSLALAPGVANQLSSVVRVAAAVANPFRLSPLALSNR